MREEPLTYGDWDARTRLRADRLDLERARAMQALLRAPAGPLRSGDPLPALWHWLYFWAVAPQDALGPDGHPARGGDLPPVALPRRMWAGSRFRFLAALPLGRPAERRSRVVAIEEKQGRSGPLVFVTDRHEIAGAHGPAVEEEHDIVYRAAPRGDAAAQPPLGPPLEPPGAAQWQRAVTPDPVLLFRYSALTFNGHRIHYDRDYCREAEGYPGLVVHGPLLATYMVALAVESQPGRRLAGFSFRALAPVFDTAGFRVAARPGAEEGVLETWIAGAEGDLRMRGEAVFA